jgi:hypothetical protein
MVFSGIRLPLEFANSKIVFPADSGFQASGLIHLLQDLEILNGFSLSIRNYDQKPFTGMVFVNYLYIYDSSHFH